MHARLPRWSPWRPRTVSSPASRLNRSGCRLRGFAHHRRASIGCSPGLSLLREVGEGDARKPPFTMTVDGRVEPTGLCRRTAGVSQVADLQIQTSALSARRDIEPITSVIHLPRLERLGAQLAPPAALEDGVGQPTPCSSAATRTGSHPNAGSRHGLPVPRPGSTSTTRWPDAGSGARATRHRPWSMPCRQLPLAAMHCQRHKLVRVKTGRPGRLGRSPAVGTCCGPVERLGAVAAPASEQIEGVTS